MIPKLDDSLNVCVSATSSFVIGRVRYHNESSFHVISSNFRFGSNSIVVDPPHFLVVAWQPAKLYVAIIANATQIFFFISLFSFLFIRPKSLHIIVYKIQIPHHNYIELCQKLLCLSEQNGKYIYRQ
mgnify:CR=1 FL=1